MLTLLMLLMLVTLLMLTDRAGAGGAEQLNRDTIDAIVADNNIVMLNFYADWCRFSNMLAPIWEEAADKIKSELVNEKVVIGKIDCDDQSDVCMKYQISKYPTIKYIQNGVLARQEYRGPRSAQSILEFVTEELKPPVKEFSSVDQLVSLLDVQKRHLVAFFTEPASDAFKVFSRVAGILKKDCDFLVALKQKYQDSNFDQETDTISFRPSVSRTNDGDEAYPGDKNDANMLYEWSRERCVPQVREITFENAEELTEEGRPFLILFHKPEDAASVKEYSDIVKLQLKTERENFNFVTANGMVFQHPINHLGKSVDDLPFIVIDSFKHMYVFPKYEDARRPGNLLRFLGDLHSGKLHREYHYGPDPAQPREQGKEDYYDPPSESGEEEGGTVETETRDPVVQETGTRDTVVQETGTHDPVVQETPHIPRETESTEEERETQEVSSDPPESTFVHLGPSKNRYTILKDEF